MYAGSVVGFGTCSSKQAFSHCERPKRGDSRRPIPEEPGMFAGTMTRMVPFVVRSVPRLLARLYGVEVVSESTSLEEPLIEWDISLRLSVIGLLGLIAS